ncbi:MAG: Maf family protein [Beijerinckiaceae bacterium]
MHPLWLAHQPLVLASGSRTRLALLEAAGIPCEVIRPDIDERAVSAPQEKRGVAPDLIARSLAHAKALAVSKLHPGRFVLGADQTLAFAGRLLHKPEGREGAARQLTELSGRAHELHSAVIIARSGKTVVALTATARLTMGKLSPGMIERYLDAAGSSVTESVGGYQLERTGIHLFRKIAGDHTTILGLPMLETLTALRRLGLVAE